MRRVMLAAACVAVMFLCVAADNPAAQPDDKGLLLAGKYVVVSPQEVAANPDSFVNRSVQLKDRFLQGLPPRGVPPAAAAYGLRPDTHVPFRTSPAGGSNMLCFVPMNDRASVELLGELVEGSAITLLGEVKGRAGGDVVFAVSRIYRGHGDITAEQKYRLVLTVKSPQSKRELEYTIPELNKEFTITLPDSLQELNKAYRLRAGEGGEPIALKIIVKADLK